MHTAAIREGYCLKVAVKASTAKGGPCSVQSQNLIPPSFAAFSCLHAHASYSLTFNIKG